MSINLEFIAENAWIVAWNSRQQFYRSNQKQTSPSSEGGVESSTEEEHRSIFLTKPVFHYRFATLPFATIKQTFFSSGQTAPKGASKAVNVEGEKKNRRARRSDGGCCRSRAGKMVVEPDLKFD